MKVEIIIHEKHVMFVEPALMYVITPQKYLNFTSLTYCNET